MKRIEKILILLIIVSTYITITAQSNDHFNGVLFDSTLLDWVSSDGAWLMNCGLLPGMHYLYKVGVHFHLTDRKPRMANPRLPHPCTNKTDLIGILSTPVDSVKIHILDIESES